MQGTESRQMMPEHSWSGGDEQCACSVVSDSSQPQGLQPTRILSSWVFPDKNTGVGCHFLLQEIFPTLGLNPSLLCLSLSPHCIAVNSLPLEPRCIGGDWQMILPKWQMEPRSDRTLQANIRRRQWHPTPVLLPGKSHGRRSLVGCSPWGHKELDMTERLHFHFSLSCIGEGNGNPLQCSCLENPKDGGAWWAAVYGVAQSQTRPKRLSSSSQT